MTTRPVLHYHGGKWLLAPWIISHFPPHRIYVEPFGGAASVLMRKPRSYAEVYNDLDGEVVNVFRVLRDPQLSSELENACSLTPFSRDEFKLSYEQSKDPIEQARRTIFRSMAGFGSAAVCGHQTGFRSNANRSGTTPARDWSHYPPLIERYADRLSGVIIENKQASDVMVQHDGPETLHYVDPPYVRSTRTLKGHYDSAYRHEMDDAGHRELAEVLRSLEGMVVVSGYHSPLYDELYGDWEVVERAAHADGARDRIEVLWFSPNVEAQQGRLAI